MTSFRRMPMLAGILCLLLMGFTGASFGAVRFDVVPSPTEVIDSGRSEVLGSLNLVVRDNSGITGTALNGYAQIGIIYTNPIPVAIDNTTTTGIRLFYTTGFTGAFSPSGTGIIGVANIDLNGRWVGYITINMAPGATPLQVNPNILPAPGNPDFIRVDGVRGRIDYTAQPPGTNLYAQLQSINDPAANQFFPETVRVATIFDGMNIAIKAANLLLCFPTLGNPTGSRFTDSDQYIRITEAFARAFVDDNDDGGGLTTDRIDSGSQTPTVYIPNGITSASMGLGAPTNQTQFYVYMEGIPASVSGVNWASSVATGAATGSRLDLISTVYEGTAGTAAALYAFNAANQTNSSDVTIESFVLRPEFVLKSGNQTATTTADGIKASVRLAPYVGAAGRTQPADAARPRFLDMEESDAVAVGQLASDGRLPYAYVIRCNCYMLFTYVTSTSAFETGVAVANTTGDTAPFGSAEAADQVGKITFYFYQTDGGYKGSYTTTADTLSGYSWVGWVGMMLPSVSPTPLTSFTGYIIAKADFQFCHALAFLYDVRTPGAVNAVHGYSALIIPDPAIRNYMGRRPAINAGNDTMSVLAGESLDN